MAELNWNDKYAVGDHEIDEEHQELFDTVRKIEAAMARKAETGALLDKLVAATGSHFAHEEEMMRVRKYPGLALHVANHERLLNKIEVFAARHGRGGVAMDQHALNFLRDWLMNHMDNDDALLGTWMSEHKAG